MSEPNEPVELPADLPPEYAEAYRRGFERAIAEAAGEPGTEPEPAPPGAEPGSDDAAIPDEPEEQADTGDYEYLYGASAVVPSVARYEAPQVEDRVEEPAEESFDWTLHEPVDWDTPSHRDEGPADRPAWLVPLILAVLALVLLVAAFVVGKAFTNHLGSPSAATSNAGLVGDGVSPSASSVSNGQSSAAYGGAVVAVTPVGAAASCQAPNGVDSAGRKIDYAPANVYDADTSTAWRCDGNGVGATLVLKLPGTMKIGEVGLIPGYAKTDPDSGVDRYAQNDRITAVRWSFGKMSLVQHLDGSPTNRSMQTMRIPLSSARRVTITVLSSTPGARDTVAISEVVVASAAG